MVPSGYTGSSSRRSSILKPRKPRQPLQNLNFNSSSNENSPASTTKIKRRVSFAEKKHVKEFCNSVEQGTVWDNTYEEHDLSNLKVPCTSNEEHDDRLFKENTPVAEFHNEHVYINPETVDKRSIQECDVEFAFSEIIQKDPNVEDSDVNFVNTVECTESARTLLTQEEMLLNASLITFHSTVKQKNESVSITDLQSNSDNHTHKSVTVYVDPDDNVPNKISDSQQLDANNSNCRKMNVTCVEDTHMDFTEVVHNIRYIGTNHIQNNKLESTFENTSMELTSVVPALMNILQVTENLQQEQNIEKLSTIMTKETDQDTSVESNVPIPPILKPIDNFDNLESAIYFVDDRTKKFDNVSMEMTTVVPTKQTEDCNSSFHDASMEITKPLKTSIYTDMGNKDKTSARLLLMKEVPPHEHDTTSLDEKNMEMTKGVSVNIHSVTERNFERLRCDVNPCETSVNLDKTTMDNDKEMDFTTVVTPLLKVYPDNLKSNEFAHNTPCTHWNSHNSNNCRNDNIDSVLDRTTIFYNNSLTTTAVVSSLNTRDACEEEMVDYKSNLNNQESGRTVLFSNISMEITEAVQQLQSNFQIENPVIDSTEVKQSVLSENFEKENLPGDSLNQTPVPDNVLKDITASVVPSSLNSDACFDRETCLIDNLRNLKDSFSNEPTVNEVQNSVNIRTSMALHDSTEQDMCALALKENNTETACAPLNFASNDPFYATASEINQSKCLQSDYSENIVPHSRRTYTLKPLTINNSFASNKEGCTFLITNNKENCKILETNSDLQDKDSCNEQSLMEKSVTFFNESSEGLESIKLPSFISLVDVSDENTSVNIICNPEVDIETNCLSENVKGFEIIKHDDTPIKSVQDNRVNVLEGDTNKKEIFLNKRTFLDDESVGSTFEHKDQVQTIESKSSSLIVNDIKRFPIPDAKRNLEGVNMQDICADNSNLEDQNMEYPTSNINDIYKGTFKTNIESSHPCNDKSTLYNGQNLSNTTNTESSKCLGAHVSSVENNILSELEPFSSLIKELRVCAKGNEIIWDVYHENMERKMFIIGFMSCSLLVVIFLRDDCDVTSVQFMKKIQILSRLADDSDVLISIVHRIILEKLDAKKLMDLYKNYEDILSMLNYISKEVKLAMDFMFDLKRLDNLNPMQITHNGISFVSRTKRMEIILKITMNIKPFDKIRSEDISVYCLLGSVREEDVKELMTNIKRDHKFLRRYMNDVRDYIYLMEESSSTTKIPY